MKQENMDDAKNKIKQLVEKYEAVLKSGQVNKYSEEETKKGFIEPLFIALGWDISNKNEVTAEESQLQGRVDYGFYLDGRIKFYIEAKPLKANIHNAEYAKQAIRYSWNKGVDWAILTDFESLKVFYCQDPTQSLFSKLVFEIPFNKYLERFNQLWLLSKESFLEKGLDTYAREHGKMMQKISVGDQLYKHLNECREILISKLGVWNGIKDHNLLEEGVQKLLDRLVFIRVAEDRGIESPTLIPLLRAWENDKKGKTLYESMVTKFRELDSIYNSNLFTEHPFEKWNESPGVTEEVINILQGKTGYYEYDFKVIPADVLGTVYENYLGYRLAKSQKGIIFDKSAKKRKEQGIYYTPEYIVDYIVRNSLKPVLDKCERVTDLQKIKVLDPACGSGSFLIKALEVINEKYQAFGNPGNEFTKIMILQQNIYGVDLDEQAVEIARLNLLLNTLESRMPLPKLDKNIKNGNSLISGTNEELKKYFGENYRDKKPFNWEEQFPGVFKQDGFDVVIGNPPWGANIDEDSEFLAYKFPNSTKEFKDIYKIFIDKAISLLKEEGKMGFIVPNTFLYQPRYQDIKEIVDKFNYLIVNLGEKIFKNVELPSCIIILNKVSGGKEFIADFTHIDREILPTKIKEINNLEQIKLEKQKLNLKKDTGLTFDDVFLLKDAGIQYASVGAGKKGKGESDLPERLFSEKRDEIFDTPFYTGSNIEKSGWYINHNIKTYFRSNFKNILKNNEWVHFTKEVFDTSVKIVWRQTSDKIRAALMDFKCYFGKTIHAGLLREEYEGKVDLHYALSIFNSKYINFLYKQVVNETGKVFPQVKLQYLRGLPFVVVGRQQKSLSSRAKEMISLYKELYKTLENSNKWNEIKSEIEKLDRKIDEEVYKLYGLTPEEIGIVEGKNEF